MAPLEFHAFDLGFTPQTLSVPAPGTYHVVFVNDGAIFHDMTFDDGTVVEAKGDEEIVYDGETHTAANLFDALKEGYYGKL